MSKHQIIYTSCRRGINGVNDGQQIYSYDASFMESTSDNVKSLFTYKAPSLASGVMMTETIAETMPQSFMYRRLSNGSCAIVLNTYLGRDYMEGGRFGNHLSHVVICDESNINAYPCEFYGSETLRNRMASEEVSSSERPPFLPEPELLKGNAISVESVSEFLCSENRIEIYKKMLAAMLSFVITRKRIVICDTTENIIMWISALEFALPLEIALNVNFTTYEYDPSLSFSQICGVVAEGTRYSVNTADAHYTFDFCNNIYPDIEPEGDLFDFIDMGMSMSFDSIKAFHRFISEKLTYRNPDEQYHYIYSLYCLFTDGLNNISLSTFKNAVKISNIFLLENAKDEFACKLADQRDFILSANNDYVLEILNVVLERMSNLSSTVQESIRALVAEIIIASFVSKSAQEDSFSRFYSEIEIICKRNGVVIPFELAKLKNREKLLSAMRNNPEQWRGNFILDVLCDYVMAQGIPAEQLSVTNEMGQLIGGIIKLCSSSGADNGSAIIERAINKFSDNWIYLINMSLNIESVLADLPYSPSIKHEIWKRLSQTIAKKQSSKRLSIYKFFLTNNRYKYVFDIYKELMLLADNVKYAKELFFEQLKINKEATYIPKIYETYYKYLSTHNEIDTAKYREELLKMIIAHNIVLNFIDELITLVLAGVPVENPSQENTELISNLTDYKRPHIAGLLLLLASGTIFSKIKCNADIENAIKEINNLTDGKIINLTCFKATDSEKYIGWIVQNVYGYCETTDDLIRNYKFFNHSKASSLKFISTCAKEALQECKDDKDFSGILVFLEFLFNVGNAEEKHETGIILSKLGKRKIKNLDDYIQKCFRRKKSHLGYWEEIREIALTTNPILKNILNVFKHKKESGDDAIG